MFVLDDIYILTNDYVSIVANVYSSYVGRAASAAAASSYIVHVCRYLVYSSLINVNKRQPQRRGVFPRSFLTNGP